MHFSLLLGAAAAFISTTEAAPKARNTQHVKPAGHTYDSGDYGKWTGLRYRQVRGRYPFSYNGTNTTVSQVPATSATYLDVYPNGGDLSTSQEEYPVPTDCPSDVVISTTTLEVTVYVTEEGYDDLTSAHETTFIPSSASTGKWHNETASTTTTVGSGDYETPDTDGGDIYYPPGPEITATASTGRDYYHTGSHTHTHSYGNSTLFSASTTAQYPHGSSTSSFTTARHWNRTSASSVGLSSSTGSSSIPLYTTGSASTTKPAPKPTEDCVIDTTVVPVTTATLTITPIATDEPTRTVSEDDAPTGTPELQSRHCGVHGLPVGNYFLARFVENSAGVPVTLEGCYQFCNSVMEATKGCKSYRFYPERGINAPRCDIYGSPVAYALDKIEERHPDIWFDLECGSPRSTRWAGLPGLARLRELGLE